MCGIAGMVLRPGRPVDWTVVERILDRLAHRGPDDQGWLTSDGNTVRRGRARSTELAAEAVLLHRRLAILDLSKAGWQPMSSADGRYHLTFNGEIYNFLELRAELAAHGHRFHSGTDTEVLLAAFATWGVDAFRRFIGMFALGLVDLRERTMLLVRDFFGIKPLYYAEYQDGLAFASEMKALLELPGVHRQVNAQRLYDYLRFGLTDHGTDTLLASIKQVPAAHYLTISLDWKQPPALTRYWTPGLAKRSTLTFNDAAEQLRELFLQSIRFHLRSDVPIGAALSGGIDSSAIVMAMRMVEPGLDLRTYSFIADDPALSEERWVDIVGAAAGARVHKTRANASQMVAGLRELIRVQDEPFGGSSIYAQNRVFQAASADGIKVMLDGQGADEILGGYRYFIAARLVTLWRQRRFAEARRLIGATHRLPGMSRLGLLLRAADYVIPPQLQGSVRRLIGRDLLPGWLRPEWFAERGVIPPVLCYSQSEEVLHDHLRRTLTSSSLPHLLRYEDRNSMAYSIESRVPFLTPELVDFTLSLPEDYLISPSGQSKAVFRQAMRGIVPDPILDRKDKIGFATPQQSWLMRADDWVNSVLDSETARSMPPLNTDAMRREWNAARRGAMEPTRVWQWLNLIDWSAQVGAEYV
jgi:asparagine synthase (glutamine-hydrolysing)